MKTHTRFAALAAGALALSAFATTPALADRFKDWDANQSGAIEREEFQTGMRDAGKNPISGDAPYLTRQDFHRAIGDTSQQDLFSYDSADAAFDDWDADANEQLTEDEFSEGWFTGYDADQNDQLDENEFGMFEEGANEGGWFE